MCRMVRTYEMKTAVQIRVSRAALLIRYKDTPLANISRCNIIKIFKPNGPRNVSMNKVNSLRELMNKGAF